MTTRPVIEVENLMRKFGDLTAVDGVTFHVNPGEVFGFLGPNGAGKTTAIGMLCTLLRPTSGLALVNGFDIRTDQARVRQSIGLIFQDPSLDDKLSGRENLKFHAMLYDVPADVLVKRSEQLLDMVDLSERADEVAMHYSGGMKRRLEIVRGLLHRPSDLFLDEPTLGLDPQTRLHIWEYLLTLREREGVTMFMTTHYMEEAEHCDRIAIIDQGKIVGLGTPEALKGMVGGDVVTVRTDDNDRVAAMLQQSLGIETRIDPEGGLIIETSHGDQFIPEMMRVIGECDETVHVNSVHLRRPTLEDVFIKLTGRAIREQDFDKKDDMRKHVRLWRGR